MNEEQKIDPNHSSTRAFLRFFGPTLIVIGVVLFAIAIVDFFGAFNNGRKQFDDMWNSFPNGSFGHTSHESTSPRYFWCAFVGAPMVAVGLLMTRFGYAGVVVRYMAGEVAPVAKDTLNYVVEGSQQSIKTIATAVRDGLRSEGEKRGTIRCQKCQAENDAQARFCDHCGARNWSKPKPVPRAIPSTTPTRASATTAAAP